MSLVTWGLHTTFYSTLTVTQLKLLWLMDFTADVTGYFLNKVQQGGGNKKSRKQQTDRSASVCLCLSLHNHADYINHHQLDRFHRIVSVLIRYLVCLLGTDRLTLHRRYNKPLPPPVCYFKPTQQLFGSPNSCFSSSPLLQSHCNNCRPSHFSSRGSSWSENLFLRSNTWSSHAQSPPEEFRLGIRSPPRSQSHNW